MKLSVGKKRKKNNLVILASISFCLLVLILVSIYLINKASVHSNPSERVSESTVEKTEEVDNHNDSPNNDISKKEAPDSLNPEVSDSQKVSEIDGDKEQPEVAIDNGYIEGQTLPSEPTYIDGVLVANKKYPLPQNFNPGEDVEARAAFQLMIADARKVGFELVAFSTYRSFEYQETLYNNYVERDGKENADRYSARPGYSEHQTGLAFDIGEVGREDLWLTSEFGETEAGKWLATNAHKYGFILRYPQGKEDITGYMYESWHFRYLGAVLATEVKKSGLTLEEYLGID